MQTSEILNKAADLIEERGWTTGASDDPWGKYSTDAPLCLEGGIMAAAMVQISGLRLLDECPAARAVHEHLSVPGGVPLWEWNDGYLARPGLVQQQRTAEQVIEVLRAAALIEAARETELAKVSA